jgi:hypothetical protein
VEVKAIARAVLQRLAGPVVTAIDRSPALERQLLLQGQIAARQLAGVERLGSLADAEFRVSSQWGEDGIVEWLVANSPGIPERFIEFGVENYRESNTRFLLQNRNWRGLVLDGSERHVAAIKGDPLSWRHDLTAVAAFITNDNIEQLIAEAGFGGEIGLLSIDIDGNDYWVWQALGNVAPWLVIAEYNAVLGDLLPLTVPYRADFVRTAADPSNLYYGASVKAIAQLAAAKGYVVLGSNRAGNNLFLAREDVAAGLAGRIADRRARPSRFREARDAGGRLTHLAGLARSEHITGLPVVDVGSGREAPLGEFGALFSAEWLAAMAGTG